MTRIERPRPGPSSSANESARSNSESLETVFREFSEAWERERRPQAEDYLDRLPKADDEAKVELIYQEFCLAESEGQSPEPADFLRRFPEHEARLRRLFQLHGAIEPLELRDWAEPALLPVSGDEIGPYRLVRELGRGGFARVFLARQTDLADRPVVLKVSTQPSGEPQLLARARHPHIVEVLRHAEADGGSLHLISMPFLGGATLAEVLRELQGRPARPKSGKELLEALDRVASTEFSESGKGGTVRDLIARMSFAQAIAWMVARLAEALGHAQRLGISHGDLKPSNVLLAADGRPMLLDFNLAVDWYAEAQGRSSGGTLAYMAPEVLRMLADSGHLRATPRSFRKQADLYAMGLLLREALTGQTPELPASVRLPDLTTLALNREQTSGLRLASARGVPRALRPILARCLASDPLDRYAEANQLAEDLDRWREQRPLAFAEDPAWPFRLGRWATRQRQALSAGLLILATAGLVGLFAMNRLQRSARQHALQKRDQVQGGSVPGVFRFRDAGHWQTNRANEPAKASTLLAFYGLAGPDAPTIVGAWDRREDIQALPLSDRQDLELWLIEQQWRLASSLSAASEAPDDLRRALLALERVPDWSALDPFHRLRRELRDRLGLPPPEPGPLVVAEEARNLYALGLEAETDHARKAFAHYRRLLVERPESFWAHYRASAASHRLGLDHEVAHHLRQCLEQQPNNPALRTQYGGSLYRLGDLEGARIAFEEALRLDPESREAWLGLLLLDLRSGQPRAFDANLARLRRVSGAPGSSQTLRGLLLRFRLGLPAIPPGFTTRLQAPLPKPTEDVEVLNLQAARLERADRAEEALASYREILQIDPDYLPARFRQAVLLRKFDRSESASEFSRLIDHPRFEELVRQNPGALRAYHHLVESQIRLDRASGALAFAHQAVVAVNRGMAPALAGESNYALARAHAAMASTSADPYSLDQAVQALQAASRVHTNFLDVWYARDPIFDPIRDQLGPRLSSPTLGDSEDPR